jgi:hypothetical protein
MGRRPQKKPIAFSISAARLAKSRVKPTTASIASQVQRIVCWVDVKASATVAAFEETLLALVAISLVARACSITILASEPETLEWRRT